MNSIKISLLSLYSFNHTVTPLSHFSSSFLSPLFLIRCLSQIGVDWRLKSVAWTEDQWQHCGGLEIGGNGVVVWSCSDGGFSLSLSFQSSLSLTLILSLRLDVGFGSFILGRLLLMWVTIWWQWDCGCSDSLSQIGCKFSFCFEFLLWVSVHLEVHGGGSGEFLCRFNFVLFY